MKVSDFGRYAFSCCATVAMLAGCGSGTPLSPSPARITAERAQARPAYAVVYSFKGGTDGANPYAGLISVKGTLYGTTGRGGKKKGGTAFAIRASGGETVLHRFDGKNGARPDAALLDVNGTFYGTTIFGGHGEGTVFAITTSGEETVLHSFGGSVDGGDPVAGLINIKGTLYGTTYIGGANGYGTVFKITTSGAETVIHNFGGGSVDGENPDAGLISIKGTLYGTTYFGGANGYGTVFKITRSGGESVLHSFAGGSGDGEKPDAGLININGALYGTTEVGGTSNAGTVFSITTSGKETVLYSFAGEPDGANPYAALINVNGTLCGTTAGGGASNDGTVFSITTSGKETVLYSFAGEPDGANPYAGLLDVKGTLYGTTYAGGAYGSGTVFSLTR